MNPSTIAALCPAFDVEVHAQLGSTQDRARERLRAGLGGPAAVFSNAQSAGRGQRGRTWHSPPGAGLYLTVVWPSARPLLAQSGASLVAGLAVRAALAGFGIDAQLKWPNDVWVDQRKLGGILVEALAAAGGSTLLVGIGLNLALPDARTTVIDQPWIDLSMLGPLPDRDSLAAALLQRLNGHLLRFEDSGLCGFESEWQQADALAGQAIWLRGPNRSEAGQALGIDALGRLRVRLAGGERAISAGEVRIRTREDDDGDGTAAGPGQ